MDSSRRARAIPAVVRGNRPPHLHLKAQGQRAERGLRAGGVGSPTPPEGGGGGGGASGKGALVTGHFKEAGLRTLLMAHHLRCGAANRKNI